MGRRLSTFEREYRPIVAKAAKAFDKEYGARWAEVIDKSTLQISCIDNCLLRQLDSKKRWTNCLSLMIRRYNVGQHGEFASDMLLPLWMKEINKRLDKRSFTV